MTREEIDAVLRTAEEANGREGAVALLLCVALRQERDRAERLAKGVRELSDLISMWRTTRKSLPEITRAVEALVEAAFS